MLLHVLLHAADKMPSGTQHNFYLTVFKVLIHLNKNFRVILGASRFYKDSREKVFLTAPNTFCEHSFHNIPFLLDWWISVFTSKNLQIKVFTNNNNRRLCFCMRFCMQLTKCLPAHSTIFTWRYLTSSSIWIKTLESS